MNLLRLTRSRAVLCLLAIAIAPYTLASSNGTFLGRWALELPPGGGRAGWLEIKQQAGWLDGSILWGGGSVLPLASVVIDDDLLTVTRVRTVERKDTAGAIVRTQQLTETITARVNGDELRLARSNPRDDGTGFDVAEFSGRRIPPLPAAPDLARVRFGEPVQLFNAKDLSGWSLMGQRLNGWRVEEGALVNRPIQVEDEPRRQYGNIRTEREFEDFNLTLEVRVPEKSNSGVYLRGIYEVQIYDSYNRPPSPSTMGAIYSRIVPAVSAERPSGEWQTLDLTLVDRHVTVKLNGTTIIANQPLAGCTGGALWSDEFRPGPIYLQGDHGPVDFRHIVLRPVVR